MQMQEFSFTVQKLKIAKRGQITLPKKMRERQHLRDNDILLLMQLPSGDIVLRKEEIQKPEDMILQAIQKAPPFDTKAAWKEVKAERARERA
ncbi:AbrB/MazE/SpoVT family DNA-binding domain-containing protein [Candidatus Woesearchaeota archaeon]|nr:AbrB/MazE/SpoVT family DNA-binding domain-containing protein [Candidatus Woesearchaeota archaeon]